MKINSGLVLFAILFVLLIALSVTLGSYDTITPAVTHGQMSLSIGEGWTTGIGTALDWIFKLAVGGIFTGFGVAAFNEARKAYKLWKRSAQAGRWQAGPNANFQRGQSAPKLNKQDMLLLALSGRLPQAERPAISYQPAQQDDDDLGIEV